MDNVNNSEHPGTTLTYTYPPFALTEGRVILARLEKVKLDPAVVGRAAAGGYLCALNEVRFMVNGTMIPQDDDSADKN